MPQFLRRAPWQWLATFAILLLLACMVAGMPPHSIWGFDTDFPAGTELHGTAALGLLLLAIGIAVPARWQVTLAALSGGAAVAALLMAAAGPASLVQRAGEVAQGQSSFGRLALAAWMVAAAAQLWCLRQRLPLSAALALALAVVQGIALAAAWSYLLVCNLSFGILPSSSSFVSLPLLAVVSLLSAGLWLRVVANGREALASGAHAHRWNFVRVLSAIVLSAASAGLCGVVVVTVYSAEWLTDGLRVRAERRAEVLRRHVHNTADATVAAPRKADGSTGRVDAAVGWPRAALPVLRTTDLTASLLPTGGVLVSLPGSRAAGPAGALEVIVQLPGRTTPGMQFDDRLNGLAIGQYLCARSELGDRRSFSCWGIVPMPDALDTGSPFVRTLPHANTAHAASVQAIETGGATRLVAFAPVGELGTYLWLEIDASGVVTQLGRPLVAAMGALAVLMLAGAGWSSRRLLPELRRNALALAQAEAVNLHLPVATLMLDDQNRIVEVNPALGALVGVPPQQLLGRPMAELFAPGQGKELESGPHPDAQRSALAMGLPPPVVVVRLLALGVDGLRIPVEARLARFADSPGRSAVLMLRDLRAELREKSALVRWGRVFDEAGWGMALGSIGDSPEYLLVNPAYAARMGYTPDELIGTPVRRCVAPGSQQALDALRQRAIQQGHAQARIHHLHRDGRELASLVDLSFAQGVDGQVDALVVGVFDIDELAHDVALSQGAARRLRAVLDALPVGVWVADAAGKVETLNTAARALWGAAGKAWHGDADTPRTHASLLRRAVATRSVASKELAGLTTGSGSDRTIRITAHPLSDEQGKVVGAVVIDEDLTARIRGKQAVAQFTQLLDRYLQSSAVGIAIFDGQDRIERSNIAWDVMVGTANPGRAATVGHSFDDVLDPADPLYGRGFLRRVREGAAPTYFGEHRLLRSQGTWGWTMVVASRLPAVRGMDGQVLVQAWDVDAQRRSATELMASQTRLEAAQRISGVGDWTWHPQDDRLDCSGQLLGMLGLPAEASQAVGRGLLLDRVASDERAAVAAAFDAAAGGSARLDAECRLQRPDGTWIDLHLQGTRRTGPAGPEIFGTVQDVTDRKTVERELRRSQELLRELMVRQGQAVEDERKRIATEMHDELGQLITSLRMDLSMLRDAPASPEVLATRSAHMRGTADRMSEVVRHVASHLRPAALDLGLAAAIEWLAEDFGHRWEVDCQVELPEDESLGLGEQAGLALFRAVQESLTNIAKHAGATRVKIQLRRIGDAVALSVSDNGRGFDADAPVDRSRGGLGLLGMRERLLAIGATLSVRSSPEGTTIHIHCPVTLTEPTP